MAAAGMAAGVKQNSALRGAANIGGGGISDGGSGGIGVSSGIKHSIIGAASSRGMARNAAKIAYQRHIMAANIVSALLFVDKQAARNAVAAQNNIK